MRRGVAPESAVTPEQTPNSVRHQPGQKCQDSARPFRRPGSSPSITPAIQTAQSAHPRLRPTGEFPISKRVDELLAIRHKIREAIAIRLTLSLGYDLSEPSPEQVAEIDRLVDDTLANWRSAADTSPGGIKPANDLQQLLQDHYWISEIIADLRSAD